MSSFIKLDRKILHWGWYDEPNMLAIWVHILLNANYRPNEWHGQMYSDGEFPTSIEKLSVETGLSIQTVRTCLKKLQSTNEITIKATNKGTKIIVNKWKEYQGCDDEDNKQTNKQSNIQDNTSTNNTIRNIRNTRNTRKRNNKEKFIPPTLNDVVAYCKERNNNVDPQKFYDYYSPEWTDSNGKQVKNWKKKMISVWETKEQKYVEDVLPTYDVSINKAITKDEEEELMRLMKGVA